MVAKLAKNVLVVSSVFAAAILLVVLWLIPRAQPQSVVNPSGGETIEIGKRGSPVPLMKNEEKRIVVELSQQKRVEFYLGKLAERMQFETAGRLSAEEEAPIKALILESLEALDGEAKGDQMAATQSQQLLVELELLESGCYWVFHKNMEEAIDLAGKIQTGLRGVTCLVWPCTNAVDGRPRSVVFPIVRSDYPILDSTMAEYEKAVTLRVNIRRLNGLEDKVREAILRRVGIHDVPYAIDEPGLATDIGFLPPGTSITRDHRIELPN